MSIDTGRRSGPEILEPRRLLRSIAWAVANAQHEIDPHHRDLMLEAPKMPVNVPLEIIAAAFPYRKYRIAELVLEYNEGGVDEGIGPAHAVVHRVTISGGRAEFVAELVIDGRTEEAFVLPKVADIGAGKAPDRGF